MNVPVTVTDFLDEKTIIDVMRCLDVAPWREGSKTAGVVAAGVKRNLQADPEHTRGLSQMIVSRLLSHELFQAIVRPNSIAIMFSRYDKGDEYGVHVDAPTMGSTTAPQRRDVSFTIALSKPSSYLGGDLIIETPFEDQVHRPTAGSMIIYPATSLHRVSPITEGSRYVIVGWARSLIRDPNKRELLFELDAVKGSLYAREGKSNELDVLSRCSANLMRMWMED